MLNFMKKKKVKMNTEVFSPTKGELINLVNVSDEVFSKKLMGEGFAVVPLEKDIYSPIKGEVVSIFPTKHAIYIRTECGDEVLIHMGIETVDLEGKPFKLFVEEGDHVDYTTLIAHMDLEMIKEKGKDITILIIFTNKENYVEVKSANEGPVDRAQYIGEVSH
ncbi:PTS glucose transporter subunit IIA [Metabacillus niabensis]|uniref:PTS sugar transporter subunit IIA n=1 Tax=Metabacillus niabensis TaxID=324854 RepID=UPI0039A0BCFD